MVKTLMRSGILVLVSLAAYAGDKAVEWRWYAADAGASHYSPLAQITPANAARLRIAWTYHSGDAGTGARTTNECTPIVVDGVLYATTPALKVVALDPASGREIWKFDPFAGSEERNRGVSRGIAYWTDGKEKRLLFGAGKRLFAIDARTGKPIAGFGESGSIDLTRDLDRDPPGSFNSLTTPGVIYRNLIIVGGSVGEGPRPSAPGHVRAYDVRTGKRAWIFHTIPHPGETGHETWEGDAWKTAGGANAWGGMSVDEKRGMVFMALGSPAFDFYGGQRLGQNLFGDSVVALDAATGKRLWHYQIVHHDLWDYDMPCMPNLVSVRHNGRIVDAVAQVTKTGRIFLFDRVSGKPLFPIEERPVPPSDMAGEKASATQPIPVKPPAFTRQGFSESDITDLSPESHAYVLEKFRAARGGLFMPPSRQGTVMLPGFHGGALWGGAAFDPKKRWLFVASNNIPWIHHMLDARKGATYPFDFAGYTRFEDQNGYPAVKPPWGQLSAIDLNTGEIVWQAPVGEYAELKRRGLPPTGTELIGGTTATGGGLVFIGASKDEKFRAFDQATGKVVWETTLEAGGYATPATYEANGRQYVVIAAGGGGKQRTKSGDAIVAFALP